MNNDCKNLLIKSNQNMECARWAEGRDYYDIALSRFYYSIFQKVIYILDNNGRYKQKEQHTHYETIDHLVSYILENSYFNGQFELVKHVSDIKSLKKKRNVADYENMRISKNSYQNDLKSKCELAMSVLDSIIKENKNG